MTNKYVMNFFKKYRFLRYIASGVTAFLVDYLGFLFLYYVAHYPILVSNSISFLLAFIIGFLLNRNWTFKSGDSYYFKAHHQVVMYFILASVNFFISNGLIFVLNKKLLVPAAIAKLFTICVIALWNYIIFRSVLFKKVAKR